MPADDQHTGRYLVSLRGRGVREQLERLRQVGISEVATSSDFRVTSQRVAGDEEALLLERLGVLVLMAEPARAAGAAALTDLVRSVERERLVHTSTMDPAVAADPLSVRVSPEVTVDRFTDDASLTWGLQALGVSADRRPADGVGVAVLDTGISSAHPDFAEVDLTAVSVVDGEGADDGNGHGTHTAGTVCGRPGDGPEYGVAPGTTLLAAKVLGSSGSGREADVLAGVELAVERGARVVSMSLGSAPVVGEPYSQVFEGVASDLLAEGVVMVAAAGNDSERSLGVIAPLGRPASSPSVLAVAALDRNLAVADFSNASAGPQVGQVDLAAPGVDVLSAWPGGGRRALSGTSMATPHVAGVLALLMQQQPGRTAEEVLGELLRRARRLAAASVDVGSGLVQVP